MDSSSPSGDVEVFLIVDNVDTEAPGLCLQCTDIPLCWCCHISCLTALHWLVACWSAQHCTVVAVVGVLGVLGVLTSHHHSVTWLATYLQYYLLLFQKLNTLTLWISVLQCVHKSCSHLIKATHAQFLLPAWWSQWPELSQNKRTTTGTLTLHYIAWYSYTDSCTLF